jgi:hypothetical protein
VNQEVHLELLAVDVPQNMEEPGLHSSTVHAPNNVEDAQGLRGWGRVQGFLVDSRRRGERPSYLRPYRIGGPSDELYDVRGGGHTGTPGDKLTIGASGCCRGRSPRRPVPTAEKCAALNIGAKSRGSARTARSALRRAGAGADSYSSWRERQVTACGTSNRDGRSPRAARLFR